MVKLLVSHGAQVNKTYPMFGDKNNQKPALDFAARKPNVLELLRSVDGKTAEEILKDGGSKGR